MNAMVYLVAGLLVFLGVHSTRMLAGDWRQRCIARWGQARWKGGYALVSAVGLALLVWGYSVARQQPVQLWSPPVGMRHLAALLTWVAFVLLAAAYVPGNSLKARLHHPMFLGVKVWALAHLLANGSLTGLLLFGSFLVWAVAGFAAARRRDRRESMQDNRQDSAQVAPGHAVPTLLTVLLGSLAWAGFAFWLHGLWIGIRPLS